MKNLWNKILSWFTHDNLLLVYQRLEQTQDRLEQVSKTIEFLQAQLEKYLHSNRAIEQSMATQLEFTEKLQKENAELKKELQTVKNKLFVQVSKADVNTEVKTEDKPHVVVNQKKKK